MVVTALTNEYYINSLIDSLLEYQNSENTELLLLQQQLSKTNKKIDNMLNANELGIITDSTKQRLQELEDKKKDIQIQIAQEEISKPRYTREQYKAFFENARVADLKDQKQRKALINGSMSDVGVFQPQHLTLNLINYIIDNKTKSLFICSEVWYLFEIWVEVALCIILFICPFGTVTAGCSPVSIILSRTPRE